MSQKYFLIAFLIIGAVGIQAQVPAPRAGVTSSSGIVPKGSASYAQILEMTLAKLSQAAKNNGEVGILAMVGTTDQGPEPAMVALPAESGDSLKLAEMFNSSCHQVLQSTTNLIWRLEKSTLTLSFACANAAPGLEEERTSFEVILDVSKRTRELVTRNLEIEDYVEGATLVELRRGEFVDPSIETENRKVFDQFKVAAKGVGATLLGVEIAKLVIRKMYPSRYDRIQHGFHTGYIAGGTATLCMLVTEYSFEDCLVTGVVTGNAANLAEEIKDRRKYKKQGVYTDEVRIDGYRDLVSGVVGSLGVAGAMIATQKTIGITWSHRFNIL
ncbi:MAG: hypothetical protein IT288_01920 [Bdellovibrionales bacterium]|nr:hypothetical protein [Bdellovibrionales bacterium]